MRPRIAIQDSAVQELFSGKLASHNGGHPIVSHELSEIVRERTAYFAREELGHGRDRAGRFIQRNTLDAIHRKENRREADAFAFRPVDLPDEMVEGIQVDAADGDAGRVEGEEFAPDLFLGCVQTDDDDGMRVHGPLVNFLQSAYRIPSNEGAPGAGRVTVISRGHGALRLFFFVAGLRFWLVAFCFLSLYKSSLLHTTRRFLCRTCHKPSSTTERFQHRVNRDCRAHGEESSRKKSRDQVGMGLGPPGGRRSLGSVRDWTRSSVASGASSRRRRPWGVTSMTASSVTM